MASGNNSISQHLQAGVTSQKSKELYLSEGIAFYEARQYQLALTACEQAIQLDSNYARAFHGKGLALIGLGRYAEAILAYQQSIRLHPQTSGLCRSRMRLLRTETL